MKSQRIMSDHIDLVASFFRVLNQQGRYAFFDYQIGRQPDLSSHLFYDLLIRPTDVESFLQHFSKAEEVTGVSLSSRYTHSQALINLQDGDFMMINFTHQFVYKSLIYLDSEEVLSRNTFNPSQGYFQPSIEHLFEFAVLKQYLRFEGWSEKMLAFFEDFHVLIQEDLIDFFNYKYGTAFRDFGDIVNFKPENRKQIIHNLKALPANQLLKSINVRWHNFIGFVRQAKII